MATVIPEHHIDGQDLFIHTLDFNKGNATCSHSCIIEDPMQALSLEEQCNLWHMHLGHVNQRVVPDLHEHADGVPKLPTPDVLHKCPICEQTKLHKVARVDHKDKHPDECWQHVQIDHRLFVQKSTSGNKASLLPKLPKPKKMPVTSTKKSAKAKKAAV